MKKRFLTFCILFLFVISTIIPMTSGYITRTSLSVHKGEKGVTLFEDPPNELWNKTYGGSDSEFGKYIQQTSDNGYIIVGTTKSYGAGDVDIWLVKTDIDGNEQWNKTYGGIYEDVGYCVRETTDSGFIMAGYFGNGPDEPFDVWLIKTDLNGNVSWDSKFRGIYDSTFGKWVIELDDGYLVMAKIFVNGIPDGTDIWLIKTDFNGNEQWNKYIGVANWDAGNAVIQTSEGDFVVVGDTFSVISGEEVLLIKTDSNGNRIWRKTFDGWEGTDIKECDAGGYIISGRSHVCLIKTDIDGNVLWKKEYQWGGFDLALSVDHTADGGYIVSGNVGIGGESDLLIFKTDEDGNREWEKNIGGAEPDGGDCVIQSNDGTYVIAGVTRSLGAGSFDFWLVKVAPFENQRPNKPVLDGPTKGTPEETYYYNVSTTEPDSESLFYWFEWGDSYTPWQGPFESGETCTVPKTWSEKGTYIISVKARDIYGGDSEWTNLEVTMPREKKFSGLFLQLLENYPNLISFLKQVFGL